MNRIRRISLYHTNGKTHTTMKNAANKITAIAEAIVARRNDLFNPAQFDKIMEGVREGWQVWDEKILADYYTGLEKPESPTNEFIRMWVISELEAVPEQNEDLIGSFTGDVEYWNERVDVEYVLTAEHINSGDKIIGRFDKWDNALGAYLNLCVRKGIVDIHQPVNPKDPIDLKTVDNGYKIILTTEK